MIRWIRNYYQFVWMLFKATPVVMGIIFLAVVLSLAIIIGVHLIINLFP